MRIFITEASLISIYNKQTKKNTVPDNIYSIAKKVASIKFPKYADRLARDIDAVPLITNLANFHAKDRLISYEYKKSLLIYLIITNPNAWCRENDKQYMYVDTEYGTLGFHIYDEQYEIAEKLGKLRPKEKFKGYGNQAKAPQLIEKYIEDNYL
jgi:hypothetical protein